MLEGGASVIIATHLSSVDGGARICSSLNLLRFIGPPQRRTRFYAWRIRGAGQYQSLQAVALADELELEPRNVYSAAPNLPSEGLKPRFRRLASAERPVQRRDRMTGPQCLVCVVSRRQIH